METAVLFLSTFLSTVSGPASFYAPGDGHNRGILACGGRFTDKQLHVAMRGWRRLGCGRRVVVCAAQTGKCELTRVRDAGPFGITDGKKGWRVHTKGKLPVGWRYKGIADLSVALWKRLGRPRFLSRVHVVVLPRGGDAYDEALAAVQALLPLRRPLVL